MKKGLLLFPLIGGLMLAGCFNNDNKEKEKQHTHSANSSSVTWTWSNDFSTATAEIKCADCGETLGTLNGNVTSQIVSRPSCTESGKRTYTASVDYEGLTFETSKDQTLTAVGHTINETIIPEISPTCETDGVKAHYECEICGEYFTKNGDEFVQLEDITLPKTGHTYGTLIAKVDSTCGHDGMEAHYECSECHKLFTTDKVETTAEALTIEGVEHRYGDFTPVDEVNHETVCENCHEHVVSNHNFTYEQLPGKKHKATCQDCGFTILEEDCSFNWVEDELVCVCGRTASIEIPEKINLDLVYEDETLMMGPNATPFVVSGVSEDTKINDVQIDGFSVWDASNQTFTDAILTYWDVHSLDVELSSDEGSKVFENLQTKFVSKSITNETELKEMSKIANVVAGKDKEFSGYFELANDITLEEVEPNNNAEHYTWGMEHAMDCRVGATCKQTECSLFGFKGIFDGNFHTIYNLDTIRTVENKAEAAPFIMLLNEWGIVRNVAFHGAKLSGYSKFSLIGYGCGTVENVYVAPVQLGFSGCAATSHLELFFAGNSGEAWGSPTLKNVVVEFNGAEDVNFNDEISAVKSTNRSAYLMTSDYHGRLPICENVVVLTTNSNVRNRLIRETLASYHSSLGGIEAGRAKYESIRGGSDDFFISSSNVDIVKTCDYQFDFDVITEESRGDVFNNKGEEWSTKWNALWPEDSKVAKFVYVPEVPRVLKVEKDKTKGAAIDNLIKVTETPKGTEKLQYSIDDGDNWIELIDTTLDYTLFDRINKITVQALNSESLVIGEESINLDPTWYVAGDAFFKESTSGIGINNDYGGGYYYKDDNTTKLSGASYWKKEHEGQPETNIKYKAISAKNPGSFHASARLHYINGGSLSSINSIIPGMSERMWINVDGFDYRTDTIPFGIKKVAFWAFFTNFVVTFNDGATMDVSKIYNKGFFMTPLLGNGTSGSNSVTGYMESAQPYSKIEEGLKAKSWMQFVYDLSDWTAENSTSFSTRYLQFTQTVTLGTLTGLDEDMKTSLLGSTYEGKVIADFAFDVGLNAVQLVY